MTGSEKTNDIRVQNNDIIFVPVRGKTISIKGEVRRPGIYELLHKEHLNRLLDFAGGATINAYLERIQVDRIVPFNERIKMGMERQVLDINFRAIINEKKDYEVFDGDAFAVYSILDSRMNLVSISGSVLRPGTYQLEKAPTLRDLILKADSLLPDAYLTRADIMRTHPDKKLELIRINVQKVMDNVSSENINLRPLDQVTIYSIYEVTEVPNKTIEIYGQVRRPGRYLLPSGMKLIDALMAAGGYTEDAYTLQAEISRIVPITKEKDSLIHFQILKLPEKLESSILSNDTGDGSFPLEFRDQIYIRSNPDYLLQRLVRVNGEVRYPGQYPLLVRNERLSSVI